MERLKSSRVLRTIIIINLTSIVLIALIFSGLRLRSLDVWQTSMKNVVSEIKKHQEHNTHIITENQKNIMELLKTQRELKKTLELE